MTHVCLAEGEATRRQVSHKGVSFHSLKASKRTETQRPAVKNSGSDLRNFQHFEPFEPSIRRFADCFFRIRTPRLVVKILDADS